MRAWWIIAPGDPIDCIVEEIPNSVMDTYCWIHSTFRSSPLTLHSSFNLPLP